jgi:uncharacterized coiled-coil protein SlyX
MQADFVPTSEQLCTLTIGQLQDLISQSVEKATQPLQDRISSLEATVASQDEKIATLEATQDTLSENQLIQLQLIHKMREDVQQDVPAQPSKKTTDHIDELHRLMVEDRTQQISIAKGARLLGISKERMRQLKPLIMQDGRFELGWSTVKGKKAVVIRIRQFLK